MSGKAVGKKLKWALIGAGNGGQSMSGHLGILGFSVKIFDVFQDTIDVINKQGGIKVDGVVNGFGKIELATTNMEEAIKDVNVIIVTLPSLYHASIAKSMAPYLKDGQIVILHPTATFGSLQFRKILDDNHCTADIILGDTQTLLYTCRSAKPGEATIMGIKEVVMAAALPATNTQIVVDTLHMAFPEFKAAHNVLETGLENINAVMHPAPSLLNTGRIDSQEDFLYYWDGVTPAIGRYTEALDKERLALGKAVGLQLTPITEWYRQMYSAHGNTLSELTKTTAAYSGVKGQKTLRTRYLLEDIPYSLQPMISLGHLLHVDVTHMETIVQLGRDLLGDLDEGRTMENLGISGMTLEQLISYVNTGKK